MYPFLSYWHIFQLMNRKMDCPHRTLLIILIMSVLLGNRHCVPWKSFGNVAKATQIMTQQCDWRST